MNSSSKNISVASLYIGDLHPEATEAMLFEKFSVEGPILSIRVCRDRISRRSLGYAYINFQNYEDAERALETKNYDLIKGKPIRIMWCQRDPTLRKSGLGNVFIKNLEKNIDNKAMYNTFSVFGNILSCKIVTDEKGNSKGYGFVHFETEEAANKAISKINGMLLNGKEVYVGKFIPRNQREGYFDVNIRPRTSIFIKNFGEDMDDDKLKELFEKYGTINSVKVVIDENGISKDFGFINFEDTINAVKAIEEMNGKEFNGKCLYVSWAQGKSERENEARQQFEQRKLVKEKYSQGLNLFIKNLDETIDVEHLTKEFLPFGTISSAKVITDENGNSRGFGFVCFNSPEEANRAVAEMNGKILVSKPLYVTLARKKDTRKANMTHRYLESIPELQMQPYYHDQMLQHDSSGYFMPTIPIHHGIPLNQLTVPSRWATEFQKEYYF